MALMRSMYKPLLFLSLLAICVCEGSAVARNIPRPGKNSYVLRGRQQEVYFLAGEGSGPHRKVLYAPGDGGWQGFGVTIAEKFAAAGYDVVGLDTRRYLQSFADSELSPSEIALDFRSLADWVRQDNEQVVLVGWSEGAGLALAAASDTLARGVFAGVVAIGTTERNILAWHWSDLLSEVRKTVPNEPTFSSADFVAKVSPLPLFMIASSKDEYIAVDGSKRLFQTARDPKRLLILDAGDHKFSGKTDEFFKSMIEAASWVFSNRK